MIRVVLLWEWRSLFVVVVVVRDLLAWILLGSGDWERKG
jgi:hypothetical protein